MNTKEPKRPSLFWIVLKKVAWLLFALLLLDLFIPMDFCTLRRPDFQTTTKNAALNLCSAVESYFVEFRQWPVDRENEIENSSSWLVTDKPLMNVLTVADSDYATLQLNPRRIPFYAGRKARGTAESGYRDGIHFYDDGNAELFDPWGNYYRVMIDLDGDEHIPAPDWAKIQDPIRQPVIVWSPGPDGKDDTEKDNVTSW